MEGQEEIYLPTSVNHEELNSQAQVKEPTLPIAIYVYSHFIATWTQSSIHWNTVLYFNFFVSSFKHTKIIALESAEPHIRLACNSQKVDDQDFIISLKFADDNGKFS